MGAPGVIQPGLVRRPSGIALRRRLGRGGRLLPGGPGRLGGLIGLLQGQQALLGLQQRRILLRLPRRGLVLHRPVQGGHVQGGRVEKADQPAQVAVRYVHPRGGGGGQRRLLLPDAALGQAQVQRIDPALQGVGPGLVAASPGNEEGLLLQKLPQHAAVFLQGLDGLLVFPHREQVAHQGVGLLPGEHQPHQTGRVAGGRRPAAGRRLLQRLQQLVQPLLALRLSVPDDRDGGGGHLPGPLPPEEGRGSVLLLRQGGAAPAAPGAAGLMPGAAAVQLRGQGGGADEGLQLPRLVKAFRPLAEGVQTAEGQQGGHGVLPLPGGKPQAVHRRLLTLLPVAAQGPQPQLPVDQEEAAPGIVRLRQGGAAEGLPQLRDGQGQQPRPVQGAPVQLPGVDHRAAFGVEGAVAVGRQVIGRAVIPQGAVPVPPDGPVVPACLKIGLNEAQVVLQITGALPGVLPLGEGALVAEGAVLPEGGTRPLPESVHKSGRPPEKSPA